MFRLILREALILLLCLAVLPAAIVLLLLHSDSIQMEMMYLSREMASGGWGPAGASLDMWLKLLIPYALVQAIRAYAWSQRSLTGRRWANLYFAVMLGIIGARSVYPAWDLFYFMLALGDVPEALWQFFELEGLNVALAAAAYLLAVHCFRVFLNPQRGLRALKQ
jgi:hypothetical protein